MENNILELVYKLTSSNDVEMVKLGQTMFLEHNPTDKDIDDLNNMRGGEPIYYTYDDQQYREIMASTDINLFDIFS